MTGDILDSWHYVTYRASVTIFTNAEWDNNRSLGEDDSNYLHGKTYAFHVVDENTISSEEKVSSNSYIVNFVTRFNPSDYRTKASFKSVKGVVSVERDRINHLVEPVKPRL